MSSLYILVNPNCPHNFSRSRRSSQAFSHSTLFLLGSKIQELKVIIYIFFSNLEVVLLFPILSSNKDIFVIFLRYMMWHPLGFWKLSKVKVFMLQFGPNLAQTRD